jgi:diguanylate cyclase (GGDEF)-like protein
VLRLIAVVACRGLLTLLLAPLLLLGPFPVAANDLDTARQALLEAQRGGEPATIASAERELALGLRKLGALDEAIEQLVGAERHYQQAGLDGEAMAARLERADTHTLQGDYDRALALNLEAMEWFQQRGDLAGQARVHSALGLTWYRLEDSERALEHFERGLALYREVDEPIGIARQLNSIGVMHKNRGEYQRALDAYAESMAIRERIGDSAGIGDLYNNIAVVWWERGDLEQTLAHHRQALAIRQAVGAVYPIAQSLHNIGYSLMELERWDEARDALQQALDLTEAQNIRALARATRERLGLLAEQVGDYPAALEHARAEMKLREQMLDESRQRDVAAMQARFESAQTGRELALLRQQQAHDSAQRAQDRRLRNLALFGLAGSVLVLFLLLSRYRLRVRASREISSKNDELETLDGIVSAINRETDLRELLTRLLALALGFFDRAGKGAVLLLDHATMQYGVVAHRGYRYRNADGVRLDRDAAIERYTGGGTEIATGVWLHRRLPPLAGHPELAESDPAASLVSILLDVGDRTEGVLVLQADEGARAFCREDGGKFARLRSHAIGAVAKVRQIDQLREQRRLAEQAMEDMARVQQELEAAARTDALTALPNRRAMGEKLADECVRSLRAGNSFVVILTDVDYFKRVNDSHGHETGDVLLVEVARRLRGSLRGQDAVARWGGEEFLILLPDTDRAGGLLVAEKLRQAIAERPMQHRALEVDVRMTFGVAAWLRGEDVERTIARADAALYQGKAEGRDRVVAEAV